MSKVVPMKPNQSIALPQKGIVQITVMPSNVVELLRATFYERQRPIEQNHVIKLALLMEDGTFEQDEQIVFGYLNGRHACVNGRHRLTAVELSGVTMAFQAKVVPVKDEHELGQLYCKYDTVQRNRSAGQIISATDLADESDNGLRVPMAQALYMAVPLLMIRFARMPNTKRPPESGVPDRRLDFARQWKPAALLYQQALDASPRRIAPRFRATGCVATALATLRHQPELAAEFWNGAIGCDGLRVGDPRLTLFNDFTGRKERLSEFDIAESVSLAWNAFYQKRPLKIIKLYGLPVSIAGTPYEQRSGK